jgi:hypothetical protein
VRSLDPREIVIPRACRQLGNAFKNTPVVQGRLL